MKNRVILLTLVFIFALFCMIGCEKDRDYDEAEVVAAVKKLLPISEKVNEIYYGEGILYDMNLSEAEGAYHRADEYSLKEFGVKNISDIKNLTLSCYSKDLGNGIIQTKLSSVSDALFLYRLTFLFHSLFSGLLKHRDLSQISKYDLSLMWHFSQDCLE